MILEHFESLAKSAIQFPEGLLMELENDLSETVDQALLTAST